MKKNEHDEIKKAIRSGLRFLERGQKKDGSFPVFVSSSGTLRGAKERQSVFPACLILSSLEKLPASDESERIKKKAAEFIKEQKSEFWSWNYWKRNSDESRNEPYPDDLDDTCCAASALAEYDAKLLPVKAVTGIVNLLTYCESEEGGPYRTWIVPPEAAEKWRDIDPAVNANVAYFLSLQEVELPSLATMAEETINSEKYFSPYYHSPNAVAYFISRWYRGKYKEKMIGFLLEKRRKDGSWGNPLETALAVCAIANLGYDKEKMKESARSILQSRVGGKWKACPFIIERVRNGRKYLSGGEELTTAFCLEALGSFLGDDRALLKEENKAEEKAEKTGAEVVRTAGRRFASFDRETREVFSSARDRILKGKEANPITLLPHYFYESTGRKKVIDKKIIVDLCAAGFYGWTAYTIYDDFFDFEGDPKFLSAANVCLRELVSIYGRIFPGDGEFGKFFRRTMDRIDAANAWEANDCRAKIIGSRLAIPRRLPDYGNLKRLADRSIGFALGPAAVLYLSTGKTGSADMKNLMAFFENYIIARQLNDDAHDWESDLAAGRLSPAVAEVLAKYRRRRKESGSELDLEKDIEVAREIFWREVAGDVCGQAVSHAGTARKYLKKISIVKDDSFFEGMIVSVERSAGKAVEEQKETLEILEEYEVKRFRKK